MSARLQETENWGWLMVFVVPIGESFCVTRKYRYWNIAIQLRRS